MATINVRQLDDVVVSRLKRRAADHNRSLEGEARQILQDAVRDDAPGRRQSFLALAAKLRRETEGSRQTPSELLIRADREAGLRTPG
ncbi:MAG: hypothetical protein OXC10_00920 [Rhodospirillaceae bacterium]|nr:hypothetical protein [Rhodospirillaceae bacterium]